MEIRICENRTALGESAAQYVAQVLRSCIAEKGTARIVLSTGASQFDTLEALVREPGIAWNCVEMFHLDEYIGLDENHPAGFRRYLRERFVDKVGPLRAVHWVEGSVDCIPRLTEALRAAPIDIGLIGIGENGHIAFNDPPADFATREAYIPVTLDGRCKQQQLGEGWFAGPDEVPAQAISMTPYQIMQCRQIVSCVPYPVKAQAIERTLRAGKVDPQIPATLLTTHPHFLLYLDRDSAAGILSV